MKITFNISSKFPVRPELVKEIVRFCIRESKPLLRRSELPLPVRMTIKCQLPSWTRSGRATRNTGRINHSRVLIRVRHGLGCYVEKYVRYAHRPDCPAIYVEGTLEALVHLTGHELGHAILGFDGDMTGEYQCERFAARCLEAWRLAYQPNACMI